ncbi:hypothetical protein AQI88_02860 [Streptomyces cellostaticus]|uniref:FAD dependent oxidoreductase domain-containing protein n=1 Tax=Streptomyces cellostaticus TaxID=67285 RepID=A0A124HDU0_9ACTN|nr:hypothetical protein AQI88_02860 [Streptomyces cellostaticus]GHI02948.1 hypothetical protein Scel_12690 [Streptomyces cellostaticus]
MDPLADRLRRDGAELVEDARGIAVHDGPGRMEVRTTAGMYTATAALAAGAWSREVCRSLGVRLDLAPGKGGAGRGIREFGRDPDRFGPYLLGVVRAGVDGVALGAAWTGCRSAGCGVGPGACSGSALRLARGVRVAGAREFGRDPDRFGPYLLGVGWGWCEREWMGSCLVFPGRAAGRLAAGSVPGRVPA